MKRGGGEEWSKWPGFMLSRGWTDVTKVSESLKERGFRETLCLVRTILLARVHLLFDRRFDRNFGVDTCGIVDVFALAGAQGNERYGERYEPTSVKVARSLLSALPEDLGEYTFVDFGSGKGRMILIGSEFDFKKIVGVELSEELHNIAKDNIAKYASRIQRCFDIQAVCADAEAFPIPDEKCVFYFFNPFQAPTMKKVQENIMRSYLANPRKMYFLYYNFSESTLLAEWGHVLKRRIVRPRLRLWIPAPYAIGIYEMRTEWTPASGGSGEAR